MEIIKEDIMNKAHYDERRNYVESLNVMLAPIEDFDSIHYGKAPVTNEEYIKISDNLGGYVYINVTADSLEDILMSIARVILNADLEGKHMPKRIITDRQKLREIAPLFKEKGLA